MPAETIEKHKSEERIRTEIERIVNIGEKITLKKLGDVTVRELSLESVLEVAGEVALIFDTLNVDSSKDRPTGLSVISNLLRDEKSQRALRCVVAAATGKDSNEFIGMGISDWLKIVAALKKVMDWEELKELFTQVVPPESMESLRSILRQLQD